MYIIIAKILVVLIGFVILSLLTTPQPSKEQFKKNKDGLL